MADNDAAPQTQSLFDTLAGAFGHGVDRNGLNAFVANSQATNGLRSAQTELALQNAQKAQEEQNAQSEVESSLGGLLGDDGKPVYSPSEARAVATLLKSHYGDYKTVMEGYRQAQQAKNTGILSDPNQLGSPTQTAAQQGIQGKVAEPVALPNNFTTLPGSAPVTPQQSPQGAAQTAQTKALTGVDVARAEDEHAKAVNASNPQASLDPQTLHDAAQVVMADPSKMGQYAGFGQTGQNNKNGINNEISRQLNSAGMTTDDMIQRRALAKASVGSAGAAAKQAEVLDAFTPLVKSNAQRILDILNQVQAYPDIPIVDAIQRATGRQLGSDDLAELHSVFGTYQQEVARLVASSPTMTGVISDKARGDVQSLAPENMTASQAHRVLNRIDTEIGIRRRGVQVALDNATGAQLPVTSQRMPGASPTTSAAPSDANAVPGGGGAPDQPISLDDYLRLKGH